MDTGMGNDILFASLNALPVMDSLPPCQLDRKLSASPFPPTFDPYSFDDVDWSSIFADTTSASTPSFSSISNPSYSPSSPSSAFDSATSSLTSPSDAEWSGLAVPSYNLKHAQRPEHEYVLHAVADSNVCVSVAVENPCPALSPLSACKRERSLDRVVEEKPDIDEKPVAKKPRRRQDTTPTLSCPHSGCASVFARTHNLKVHIDTVHKGERPFVCNAADCGMAFGRRHDLYRHNISKHTDQGSPRSKNAKARK
ncbi:hypothetical protein FKP32DRAFT_1590826 [Trametes sanguinea]|nr:hypothetical protein FKP32DRAFT_1590826 [Trametes sanguinea]